MELKEFVREALKQICGAVHEAQKSARDLGAYVNPSLAAAAPGTSEFAHFGVLDSGQNVFLVDFDVAVTASDTAEGGGGAKLAVASLFSVHGGAKTAASSESTSRIRFKVPLALPVDETSRSEFDRKRAAEDDAIRQFNQSRDA